jgi:hypothetical protein
MDEVIEDTLLSNASFELERRLVGDDDDWKLSKYRPEERDDLKTGSITLSQSQENRHRNVQHRLSRHLGRFVYGANRRTFPTEHLFKHRHVLLPTAANENLAARGNCFSGLELSGHFDPEPPYALLGFCHCKPGSTTGRRRTHWFTCTCG